MGFFLGYAMGMSQGDSEGTNLFVVSSSPSFLEVTDSYSKKRRIINLGFVKDIYSKEIVEKTAHSSTSSRRENITVEYSYIVFLDNSSMYVLESYEQIKNLMIQTKEVQK